MSKKKLVESFDPVEGEECWFISSFTDGRPSHLSRVIVRGRNPFMMSGPDTTIDFRVESVRSGRTYFASRTELIALNSVQIRTSVARRSQSTRD